MSRIRRKNNQARRRLPDIQLKPDTGQLHQGSRLKHCFVCLGRRGFGLNEVIGIAAGIIIAAVVVIPGLQSFAEGLIDNLETWWSNMASSLFSST